MRVSAVIACNKLDLIKIIIINHLTYEDEKYPGLKSLRIIERMEIIKIIIIKKILTSLFSTKFSGKCFHLLFHLTAELT